MIEQYVQSDLDEIAEIAALSLGGFGYKLGMTPTSVAWRQRNGLSWGLREGDAPPLIIAGFAPSARGFEAWFGCRPEAAGHMKTFLRHAHLTLQKTAHDWNVKIFARVACGHRPGARIAKLLGFELCGRDSGFDDWIWRS